MPHARGVIWKCYSALTKCVYIIDLHNNESLNYVNMCKYVADSRHLYSMYVYIDNILLLTESLFLCVLSMHFRDMI